MTRPLIGFLAVLLLCLMLSVSAAAQASDETVLVATPTVDGIDIYSADSSGEVMLVRSLTGFRVGDPIDQASWSVSRYTDLTVSLDGSQIAFTAQRDGAWALFVYTRATDELLEIALPMDSIPVWSPDSSAMLLLPGASSQPPFLTYVYDLIAQQLVQITMPPRNGGSFRWLPDSSGLLYVGLYFACETCDAMGQALYYVSRDGAETRLLTYAAGLGLEDSYNSICNPTWSEPNQRIYYIVGCVGGGDNANEYFYSVNLAGNNRAELSPGFTSRYPEEYAIRTIGIHPHPFTTDVYLTIASAGGDSTGRSNRRILQLQSPNEVATVYEQTNQENDLDDSLLSPNGASIALITYGRASGIGFLEVLDLATGQRVIGRDSTPLDVCEAYWNDENSLFYSVDSTGACSRSLARWVRSVWVLDIASGATREVTSELGANVWMLRRVVVTAPLS